MAENRPQGPPENTSMYQHKSLAHDTSINTRSEGLQEHLTPLVRPQGSGGEEGLSNHIVKGTHGHTPGGPGQAGGLDTMQLGNTRWRQYARTLIPI
eukprot:8010316-Karenia_brevis.AAC.1